FDPEHYATAYPDVAERNVDPLVHYLEEGAREGRDPHPDFDTAFYLEQCRARGEEPANPLLHYLLIGAARGFQIKRDGKSPAVTAVFDRPPMELLIDEAVVAPDGLLRVEGWVVCLVQIETVEVFVAGERIGQAEFGRVREDVEHVRPDYPNARFSGFKLVSDIGRLGAGDKTITVRALARTGILREERTVVEVPKLRRSRRAVVDEGFHHHCDEIALTTAGHLVVKGWAVSGAPIVALE